MEVERCLKNTYSSQKYCSSQVSAARSNQEDEKSKKQCTGTVTRSVKGQRGKKTLKQQTRGLWGHFLLSKQFCAHPRSTGPEHRHHGTAPNKNCIDDLRISVQGEVKMPSIQHEIFFYLKWLNFRETKLEPFMKCRNLLKSGKFFSLQQLFPRGC